MPRPRRRSGPPVASALLALLALGACDRPEPGEAATPWPLAGRAGTGTSSHGVVVSGHPLASRVGVEVLQAGGNAVDAAVATGFALAVVLPEAGNLGGGGFLVHRAADGSVRSLDYRETAPAAATPDMFLDEAGEPTDRSRIGHLASGVPGSVAGLWEMHRELGSLPWEDLVQPAVELASGHVVDEVRHRHLEGARARLERFEASAAQFLPDSEPPAPGSLWSQPDLRTTLEAIRDGGRDAFYEGPVADLVVAEMERGGGLISHGDLASYRAVWREPVTFGYRGYRIHSMPPPSSGGLTLALIFRVLEGWSPLPPFGGGDLVHLEAEAMRRAFLERNRFLGDPDVVDVPVERFLSRDHAAELRAGIDPERATATPPTVPLREGSDTTHYSVVDAAGNAASVTTTINSSFGSGVTVAGAGFLLNNEMDDFATAPGRPNQFGLVEGDANAVAPGKRMLSSMSPTIVEDPAGGLFLVLGSPGGPTIITSVFQVISNVIDHGMDLPQAVESPRVHHQALPDVLLHEPDALDADALRRLRDLGHEPRARSTFSGDVAAVMMSEDGALGVADPRRGAGVATVPPPPES